MDMKSAIRTITQEINSLRIEKRIWSKKPNYNHEILGNVELEIQEHRDALKVLIKESINN